MHEVCARIALSPAMSLDTETTGLYPWQGDRLFSTIIAIPGEAFYFNFKQYPYMLESDSRVLPRSLIEELIEPILNTPDRLVFFHHAKFDMAMVYHEGVNDFNCQLHDNMVLARLIDNDRFTYSMESLAPWVGREKTDLDPWAKENGYWDKENDCPKFTEIPLDVIQPYGEMDAIITLELGLFCLQKIRQMDGDLAPGEPLLRDVANLESETTKALFHMERRGVLTDARYIEDARVYETERYKNCAEEFEAATGIKFVDSRQVLARVFNELSPSDMLLVPKTAKGNDSFKDEVVKRFTHPLAAVVREHRAAYKRAGTYFSNYQALTDSAGYIHCSFNQSVATGRLSCRDPNLQNVIKRKDKTSQYPIRRSFIVPKDYYWVSFDYDQMEYRLMLDDAGEMTLIAEVLGGLDVHDATAKIVQVERDPAKTINFMLLYGGGDVKLCISLFKPTLGEEDLWLIWKAVNGWLRENKDFKAYEKIPRPLIEHNLPLLRKAAALRAKYFEKLPQVGKYVKSIKDAADRDKKIYNWNGRVYNFKHWYNKETKRMESRAYSAPNYKIQGGCADIVKRAMVQCEKLLKDKRSRMILQVHDELNFYIHKDELDVVPQIREIMETVYKPKFLKLTAGCSISETSWGDTEDFEKWLAKKNLTLETR